MKISLLGKSMMYINDSESMIVFLGMVKSIDYIEKVLKSYYEKD